MFNGMLTLAKGAILARIIGIANIPILTRLYSPEEFGILALYVAITGVIAPILTLRYVQAIPLPKSDVLAINLFSVCLKLIILGTLIASLIFWSFGREILASFNMQILTSWWPLIIIGSCGAALYELFSLWATRKKQYELLASTQITQSLLGNVTKVVLGLAEFKSSGLLVGQLFSQSGGVIKFIKRSWEDFSLLMPKVCWKKEKLVSEYYRHFPYYRLPSQFLMLVSIQAPVLIMSSLYGKDLTGQLSLAVMALSLPTGLIGAAVSKAYYAEIAALGKNHLQQVKKITIDVQKKLFLVGVPFALIVMVIAEPAFVIVFGENWATAGKFASILSPFILLQFTSAPLVQVINVVGSQFTYLIINAIRFTGLGLVFFIFKSNPHDATVLIGVLSAYLSLFYFLVTCFIFFVII